VLSGQREPTRGAVRLNGISLYERREHLVPFIAHMPQEEALNPQLTVREHLRHAVTIRRPALSLAEHERRVDSILAELGLQSIARRKVGSPGDKTSPAASAAASTSGSTSAAAPRFSCSTNRSPGLSSKDSEHVAETLRSLAREKIVIASLHRPGAPVLRLFDKVLLLDSGGRLAYFGTPAAMVGYFRDACTELGIPHPPSTPKPARRGLRLRCAGNSAQRDRRRLQHRRGAAFPLVLLAGALRKRGPDPIAATAAADRSRAGRSGHRRAAAGAAAARAALRAVIAVFATHFLRSLLSKLRNRGTIYSTCLEAPLLAALIAITLRSSPVGRYEFATALHIPAYLFLSATVAMFLGLTNSATEILRDRPIMRRERNCQPGATILCDREIRAARTGRRHPVPHLSGRRKPLSRDRRHAPLSLDVDDAHRMDRHRHGTGGLLHGQNRARGAHCRAAAARAADAAGRSAGFLQGNEPRPVQNARESASAAACRCPLSSCRCAMPTRA
jgi:ABC transport system ATP-binding/permease protein